MTKITKITILLTLLIAILVSPVYASNLNNHWTHEKPIEKINVEGYKYIELDEDVYKYSKEDLSDLRILNSKGDYVPYLLESNKEINTSITDYYESSLIDTFQKLDSHYFDFEVAKQSNTDSLINYMELNINHNGNYAKTVEIYGSYDNEKWDFITKKEIYEISVNSSDTSINFDSLLKYEYYRVVILDNIENITLSSIDLNKVKTEYKSYQFIKSTTLDYKVVENKSNNTTEITIDNKSNLKITDLLLDVEGEFYRQYEVYYDYGQTYTEGLISKDYSNINMDIYNNSKEIKIIIQNNDDKPLVIKGITEEYTIDQIIFFANKDEQYSIQFGNQLAKKPIYDLVYKKDDIQVMEQMELGTINKLEIIIEEPVEEFNFKLLMNVIILIVSVLLMFVLIKTMKKE